MPKAKASDLYQLEEAWATHFMGKYNKLLAVGYPWDHDLPQQAVAYESRLAKGIYPRGRAYQRLLDREYEVNCPINGVYS